MMHDGVGALATYFMRAGLRLWSIMVSKCTLLLEAASCYDYVVDSHVGFSVVPSMSSWIPRRHALVRLHLCLARVMPLSILDYTIPYYNYYTITTTTTTTTTTLHTPGSRQRRRPWPSRSGCGKPPCH